MTDTWTVVAGVGSAVGGLAAAASAFFAWRSASASRDSSRDAAEALAIGMRPYLDVRTTYGVDSAAQPTGTYALEIDNRSAWTARDVRLELRYRDGHIESHRREVMSPNRPAPGEPFRQAWSVPIDAAKPVTGRQDPFGDVRDIVGAVVVTYSDEREIARYELHIDALQVSAAMPFDSGYGAETRIR